MEEKERYLLEKFEIVDWVPVIVDKELGKSLTFEEIKNLLNQQDEEIKELKQHSLNDKEWQDYCAYKRIEPQIKGCLDRENKLIEENKQLKQELARYVELFNMEKIEFYVIEKSEYEKMKQGAKDICKQSQKQQAINELNDVLKFMVKDCSNYYKPPFEIKKYIEDRIKILENQL